MSAAAADLVGLGEYLVDEQRLDTALRCFDLAIEQDRGYARAHCGRGRALYRLRRAREALASFERALRFGASPARVAEDCWMCAMLTGDFAAAWQISDLVLARRGFAELNRRDQPLHLRHVWDGTKLAGRDVLVRCYHGLGDTIQFIRFAPALKRLARSVTVQAVPALHGLLGGCAGIDRLAPLDYGAPDPAFEVDIELLELPHALRTDAASIPANIPYVRLDPARVAAAAHRLRHESRLRVGLVWRAGDWDPRRSIPLWYFARLNSVPGIALFNLQRGEGLAELETAPVIPVFADGPAASSDDMLDTAATVANLDLVISVDTMVAHLAGALGAGAWTLLQFAADWRWMLDRADSPWYPTMTLFRQPAPSHWSAVIETVASRLHARAAAHRGALTDAHQ